MLPEDIPSSKWFTDEEKEYRESASPFDRETHLTL
jgi:hypothetical protein